MKISKTKRLTLHLTAVIMALCAFTACTQGGEYDNDNDNGGGSGGGGGSHNQESGQITASANRLYIDAMLDKYYLYNDAYRQTSRNYNQSYSNFLEDVLDQMHAKGQNPKDGFDYDGEWYFYSYVEREKSAAGRAEGSLYDEIPREYAYGTGMYLVLVRLSSNPFYYGVTPLWVYPDSPAYKAGIRRGDLITQINGQNTTLASLKGSYADLLDDEFYSKKSYKLSIEAADGSLNTVTVETDYYYPNPILFERIYNVAGRIAGYLVYNGFDAAYDNDLLEVFDRFKAAGVEDVILDLRYNGGGHVISSRLLSAVLAGPHCKGKVFAYYRYNDERMKKDYDITDLSDATAFPCELFDGDYERYADSYGFENVYVIGGRNTASASELTINSLRGLDRNVILIGCEPTNGKDVGMEVTTSTRSFDGYVYTLAPISFQTYNAKGESDYDDGFTPDIKPAPIQSSSGTYHTYDEFMPEDWGMLYPGSNGSIQKFDYLADALYAIAGGTLSSSDLSVVTDGGETALTAVVPRCKMMLVQPATRSGNGNEGLRIRRRNPFENNMVKPLDDRDRQF